ncbi:coiled-coil domain-containing protein 190 isoform X1 [Gopherus flavomarginatus]|uniref:coiled-coil domain-containing protein 190 isoform X1 n=2 Tax=Gopherus flavomarginatus TaxID=286002 RepID=UPI0021CBE789|nr:coiled-coil domain-containing protein 190 isoform X1 [Gopherus flavomarginatus]XP_050819320.1 coiled-coil domain-containing protein 190 isoform X1 [Gopherus flavomarginatus]XP_050819321.1 coiled-coil domain-containing protein 190 isoform X1 [Gopherus flavomarginatus]XP_050819322.1 coiled-coil domain-containing protein 190 isoform X1 [Gopherus flavomarginatus]
MAEGDPSKRWELERQYVKQAEARLSHGLQDLEEARLYQMNSMIREQRQIQKELQRLQQGNSRKKALATLGDLSQEVGKRPVLPMLPTLSGQQHRKRQAEQLRAPSTTLPKMEGLTQTAQSPLQHQKSDRDILDDEGQESCGRHGSTSTRTQAKAASSITDISLSDLRHSIAKRLSTSANPAEQEETNSQGELGTGPTVLPCEQTEASDVDGSDTMPKPTSCTERRKPSLGHEKLSSDTDPYVPDRSHLRPMHSRPGFLELYAEARKARYIRHKGIPASEKELSLQEIFGHENSSDPSPPAAEQEHHSPE